MEHRLPTKYKKGKPIPWYISLEYYTPKTMVFQAHLYKFAIFVNSADFYVNAVMLTAYHLIEY